MGMWQYAFSSLKEGRQLLYYVWRIAAVCLTPATHSLCMRKKCQLRMQICISKANIIACFSSSWENTTALFFFPPLRNKVGALRYPSVSKTVVCTVDIVFAAAASLLCYQRGVKSSAADYITLSKQRSRAQDLFFFFIFSPNQCRCVCTNITLVCMYLLPLFRSIAITEPRWQNQMIDSVTKNTLECLWPLYTSQPYCNVMGVTGAEHFLILKTSFYRFSHHKCPLGYI